jgi:hypothetical protein
VSPLLGYLRGLGAVPAAQAQVPSAPVDKLLAEFAGYLVHERGLSARSVTSYQHHARPFLAGLAPPLDTALAELSAAEVTAFMVDHRGRWGTGIHPDEPGTGLIISHGAFLHRERPAQPRNPEYRSKPCIWLSPRSAAGGEVYWGRWCQEDLRSASTKGIPVGKVRDGRSDTCSSGGYTGHASI